MHTCVICPRGVNIGNRPLIEAKMKGCQVREWIVGENHMSFSRILYMIYVNGGYLVSEIFNNIDRKTWREIKETLQWPPMEIQLVVYTQLVQRLNTHVQTEKAVERFRGSMTAVVGSRNCILALWGASAHWRRN